MKYIHSLLIIPHHQLKVNRKFNMNFNLNMKFDRVTWSPTTSHPPPLHPLPWPTACPLHPYAFHPPCCFWIFEKNWKEEGNNSSIGNRHSWLSSFGTSNFFKKKFVYPHGDIFYSLSWQLQSPLVGAVALFQLTSPSRY